MNELAEVTSKGQLTSFSGVFKVHPLSELEQTSLEELLKSYQGEAEVSIQRDLDILSGITSEIKAISNQAAILHGERIQRAQEVFKNYRDGAFSAWLLATYGNRQTPYNFLQYYEFHRALPSNLISKLDEMPRQAVYTLASRDVPLEKKKDFVENYSGETKNELLELIRQAFPLEETDRRREDLTHQAFQLIAKLDHVLNLKRFKPTAAEALKIKEELQKLLSDQALK